MNKLRIRPKFLVQKPVNEANLVMNLPGTYLWYIPPGLQELWIHPTIVSEKNIWKIYEGWYVGKLANKITFQLYFHRSVQPAYIPLFLTWKRSLYETNLLSQHLQVTAAVGQDIRKPTVGESPAAGQVQYLQLWSTEPWQTLTCDLSPGQV